MQQLIKQDVPPEYMGMMISGDDQPRDDGYGMPFEKQVPDFVKKDNDGWVYVTPREE